MVRGARPRANARQPLDPAGRWFVAPRFVFTNEPKGIYQSGDLVAIEQVRRGTLAFDVGRQLGTWGQVRVGYERTAGDVDVNAPRLSASPRASAIAEFVDQVSPEIVWAACAVCFGRTICGYRKRSPRPRRAR